MSDPLLRNENREEDDYMGNMWGWNLSWVGLVLLIVFGAIFVVRQCTHPEVDVFEQEETIWEQGSND